MIAVFKRGEYDKARISEMVAWNLLKGRNVELGRPSYFNFPEIE